MSTSSSNSATAFSISELERGVMTSKATYVRTDHVDWSVGADGRMTVKDTESNWFFPLNSVATLVWDMMDGANTVEEIVAVICHEFAVDEATARADIADFIDQALDLNLVEESFREEPSAASFGR